MQQWQYLFVTCEAGEQSINAISVNGTPVASQPWAERKEGNILLLPRAKDQSPQPVALHKLSKDLGEMGWELFAIGWDEPMTAVFKRPKSMGQ
jgi:hypothetical protein